MLIATLLGANGGLITPSGRTAQADGIGTVTATGVAANQSSVKISYQPVAGAQDYRVFDVTSPTTVKYAGMLHLDAGYNRHFVLGADGVTPAFPYAKPDNSSTANQPATLDVPNVEIEWNALGDGKAHTLIVQALDALGPIPPANLYDDQNASLVQPIPPSAMVGANTGSTPDGNVSINGQGAPTNAPRVLAQSAPFMVQADPTHLALPSRPDAQQTFLDPFANAEAASLNLTAPVDP